ncbi:Disease resistance protein RPP8 [Rhynchospora pubera]|nr:Disease resistance protein RPP8 [Rhynchospora pubera]
MVQVSERNWDGSIDYCRIHDVLHSLAIQKAKEDNFMMACSKIDEMQNCSQQTRRLAIHQTDYEAVELYGKLMPSATPNLRSLYISHHNTLITMPKVSQLVHLKALHYPLSIDYEPENFGRLNQLRYFSVGLIVKSKDVCSFQKFIGGMRFLQTLDLTESDIPCDLPDCVWQVKTLRHVILPIFPRYFAGPPSSADLINLQTLMGVQTRESWKTTRLPKLPNMKYFRIKLCNIQKDTVTTLLHKLEHLISLEINEVYVPYTILDMREFPFYDRLQTLGLWLNNEEKIALDVGMLPIHLTWLDLRIFSQGDPMPVLEKLQNLRYLSLAGSGFQQMCCSAGGFVHLEELSFQHIEVEEWEIEEGALPMLKDLSLANCHLSRVPHGLQHLTLLQRLDWDQWDRTISKTMENVIRILCKHVPAIYIKPVKSDEEQISDEEKRDEEQSDEENSYELQSDD